MAQSGNIAVHVISAAAKFCCVKRMFQTEADRTTAVVPEPVLAPVQRSAGSAPEIPGITIILTVLTTRTAGRR